MYTACNLTKQDAKRKEGAIGIVDGIAAADEGATGKQKREALFPFELAKRALMVRLQTSKASVESDRTRILNAIVGAPLDAQPPEMHEQFDRMNAMLVPLPRLPPPSLLSLASLSSSRTSSWARRRRRA